jgi:hypothetical protein
MSTEVAVPVRSEHRALASADRSRPAVVPSRRWQRGRHLVALVLVAAAASGLVLVRARNGVSTGPDSAIYLGVARSLAAGHGFDVPIHPYPVGDIGTPPAGARNPAPTALEHYPPLEPVALAMFGHPIGTALVEGSLLLGATVLLVGLTVLAVTRALWLALAAEVVVASPRMISNYSSVGSEALGTFLVVLALALLAWHLARPRAASLVGASGAAGLALVTRFAAGGVVVLGLIALRRRPREALAFLLISAAPLAAWFLYQQTQSGAGHRVQVHLMPSTAKAGARAVADWVLPWHAPQLVAAVTASCVLVAVAVLVRRRGGRTARLFALFAVVQLLFLVVAITFVDGGVNLEPRILLPIFVALVVAVACCIPDTRSARIVVGAAVAASVLAVAVNVVTLPGTSYASTRWTKSPLIERVRRLPAGDVVYTNAPDALYLVAHRATSTIPEKFDFSTREPNPRYTRQLAEIRRTLTRRRGYVVYVRGLPRNAPSDDPIGGFVPSERELRTRLGLRLLRNTRDGAIYTLTAT